MISGKCYFCMKSICTRGISLRIVRRNTNMLVFHADITWAVSLGCPWCVGVSGFLAHTRIFLWCFPGPMERYTWNPKSQGKKQVRGDEVVFRTKLMRGILVYYRAKCSDCQSQIYFCPVIINNLYSLPLNPKTTEKSLRWHLTVLLWALRDAAYGLSTENSNRAWVRSYQEGLIGALTEGRVIRAIDGRLTGELWVKLTHVVSRLLRRQKRGHAGEGVQQHEHVWNRRGCDSRNVGLLAVSRSSTHQKRLEGRLHFPSQQLLPVDVSEEGMTLWHNHAQSAMNRWNMCALHL